MNLLSLVGEHRRQAAAVALVLAVLVVSLVAIGRWRSPENRSAPASGVAAASGTPPPPTTAPSSEPSPAEAQSAALAFCRQYFASSWQESPVQEEARVEPYLTARALEGWRADVTPAEAASHQTVSVTACSATDEGLASSGELGYFLDAQVVTTSTGGAQTGTDAAEIFLIAVAGVWKVDQVRA